MIDCFVLGDSIAQGIAQHTTCASQTQVGISAPRSYLIQTIIEAKTTIISLGSNDSQNTIEFLVKIRNKIDSGKVIWIVPYLTNRDNVIKVALRYKDTIIDIRNYPMSPDMVHPTTNAYRMIARTIR